MVSPNINWLQRRSTPFKVDEQRTVGLHLRTLGRNGLFAPDEGKSWADITPIVKDQSTGYSDVIEVGAGKLFVVYDSLPKGGDPVPGASSEHIVCGTFVEVQKR